MKKSTSIILISIIILIVIAYYLINKNQNLELSPKKSQSNIREFSELKKHSLPEQETRQFLNIVNSQFEREKNE